MTCSSPLRAVVDVVGCRVEVLAHGCARRGFIDETCRRTGVDPLTWLWHGDSRKINQNCLPPVPGYQTGGSVVDVLFIFIWFLARGKTSRVRLFILYVDMAKA